MAKVKRSAPRPRLTRTLLKVRAVLLPLGSMTVVAAIGIVINGGTALLFARGRKGDVNIRGAYLHMAADALVSAGVVVAGIGTSHPDATAWEEAQAAILWRAYPDEDHGHRALEPTPA